MLNAYDQGFQDGTNKVRKDRVRHYQTDKAEKSYWQGYLDGIAKASPGKMIVRCEREGAVFATIRQDNITCPVCGRGYCFNGKDWESDRLLTILKK